MNTTNETSLTRAADPASVFIGSTLDTSTGSVVFDGLEKEGSMEEKKICRQANSDLSVTIEAPAESVRTAPVSSGFDAFELIGLMYVAEGRISETRFRRAMDAVRKGVDRA